MAIHNQTLLDEIVRWLEMVWWQQFDGIIISLLTAFVLMCIFWIIRTRTLPVAIQSSLIKFLDILNHPIPEHEKFVLNVEEAETLLYVLKPEYDIPEIHGFFHDATVQGTLLVRHPLVDAEGKLHLPNSYTNHVQMRKGHHVYIRDIVAIYSTYRKKQSRNVQNTLPVAYEFAEWWNHALLETIEKQYSLFEKIVKTRLDEIDAQLRKMQSFESSISDYFRIVNPSYNPASQDAVQAFYSGRSMLSWEIVAAGAVVPRQQRAEFIARYGSEIPTQFELVCVTGEMGEGKTTFLWDVAYEIKQKLNCVLIQCIVTDPAAWGKLANAVNDERLPVIVIVDDVFASDSFKQAMYAVGQVNLPIRILATSRTYDLPKYDQFVFEKLQLNPPTRIEIDSLVSRFAPATIDYEQRQRLYNIKSWLVLMMEMSSGSEFQNVVIQSLEYLRKQDQNHYLAYLYVCFVAQYNIAVPRDLLSALRPEFRNVQIPGYIFDLEMTNAGSVVRAAHTQIARVISEHVQPSINVVDVLCDYFAHADFTKQSHRYMLGMLGAALVRNNEFTSYSELFVPLQSHIQRWFAACTHVEVFNQITTILYALNAESELALLYRRMLATVPQNVSDWRSLLMYADRTQQKVTFNIITALKSYAQADQQDAGVWDLVVMYLNADRSNQYAAQQLIPLISSMIGHSPLIRAQYLELVERFGSNDHVNVAITQATSWLGQSAAPKLVIAYARLVVAREKNSTTKQLAITTLQPYIPLDNAFAKVHPELFQYYIELLHQTNRNEQITQTMQMITALVKRPDWNPFVFRKYILLVSLVGNDTDKLLVLSLIADAISQHREEITPYTMNTVWYMVEQLYPRSVKIDIHAYVQTMKPLLLAVPAWLMINTNHKIHSKYLTAVSRCNDNDIHQLALKFGDSWVQSTPIEQVDLFVFTGYCKLFSRNFISKPLFMHMLRIAEYIFAANEDDSYVRSNVALLLSGRSTLLSNKQIGESAVRLLKQICVWIDTHDADIRLLNTLLTIAQILKRHELSIQVLHVVLRWYQSGRDMFADMECFTLFLRFMHETNDPHTTEIILAHIMQFNTTFNDKVVFNMFFELFEQHATTEQRDAISMLFYKRLCADPTDVDALLRYFKIVRTHTQSITITTALQDQYNWRLIHGVPEIQEAYIQLVIDHVHLADMAHVARTVAFWQRRGVVSASLASQLQLLSLPRV